MSDRPIKLVVIDDDPIFRLGISTALTDRDFADIQVTAQGDTASIYQILAGNPPDLLLLALDANPLALCEQLIAQYPELKIFLLTFNLKKQQLIWLKSCGVKGYAAKGTNPKELVNALRRVASGESYWQNLPLSYSPSVRLTWFSRQCQLGLEQINSDLEAVEKKLSRRKLPLIDYLFWRGRKRELLAASWLVKQVFPGFELTLPDNLSWKINIQPLPPVISAPDNQLKGEEIIASTIFDRSLVPIRLGVQKSAKLTLEIDMLDGKKKQELLLIVLEKINKTIKNLRLLEITSEDLEESIPLILQDIWQSASIDFLSKYYLLQQENQESSILGIVSQQSNFVQGEILSKIPFLKEYLSYLLFEKPLVIDGVAYRVDSPEALERGEFLLQNLIITIANSVVMVILNNLNLQDKVIKIIYNRDIFSSREIAKIRNELSWKYWLEKYWEEPRNIFEDRYRLLVFEANTISKIYINAPRKEELEELRGIAWLLTMVVETQDAIIPRLKTLIDWLGRGLVYILTEIIGRGIGLIGRGIIQGIGNSLQKNK